MLALEKCFNHGALELAWREFVRCCCHRNHPPGVASVPHAGLVSGRASALRFLLSARARAMALSSRPCAIYFALVLSAVRVLLSALCLCPGSGSVYRPCMCLL